MKKINGMSEVNQRIIELREKEDSVNQVKYMSVRMNEWLSE